MMDFRSPTQKKKAQIAQHTKVAYHRPTRRKQANKPTKPTAITRFIDNFATVEEDEVLDIEDAGTLGKLVENDANQSVIAPVQTQTFITEVIVEEQFTPGVHTGRVDDTRFPGFTTSGPAPLPGELCVDVPLSRVLWLNDDGDRSRVYPSLEIAQDLFWWWFCKCFQATNINISDLDKLFARIAENFVFLVLNVNNHVDSFFLRYHDLLAQTVFSIFCICFPKSLGKFDGKFIDSLVSHCSRITGIKPSHPSWNNWNLGELASTSLEITTEPPGEKPLVPKLRLAKLAGFGARSPPTQEDCRRVVSFNVSQHSVLVDWFLRTHNVQQRPRKPVTRTEVPPSPPPPYLVQAEESARNSARVLANYTQHKSDTTLDCNIIRKNRIKTRRECDQTTRESMEAPLQLKTMASGLVHDLLKPRNEGDEGAISQSPRANRSHKNKS